MDCPKEGSERIKESESEQVPHSHSMVATGITDRVAQQEEKKGKQFVLDQMKRMASNTAFIQKMQYQPHEAGDVILITGVGEAFPFIRVHALLEAMQPHFNDIPILVMYPGTFDGRSVKLFDKLTPNPYYRAFSTI